MRKWLVGVSSIRTSDPVSQYVFVRRVGKTAQVTGSVSGQVSLLHSCRPVINLDGGALYRIMLADAARLMRAVVGGG